MEPTDLAILTADYLVRGAAAAQVLAAAGLPADPPNDVPADEEARARHVAGWATALETEAELHGLASRQNPAALPAQVEELTRALKERDADIARLHSFLTAQTRSARIAQDALLATLDVDGEVAKRPRATKARKSSDAQKNP